MNQINNNFVKKGLILGIIMLFAGASVVHSIVSANQLPVLSNPYPSNGSIGVTPVTNLHINIINPDGDNLNITWYSNSSGAWLPFAQNRTIDDAGDYFNSGGGHLVGWPMNTYWVGYYQIKTFKNAIFNNLSFYLRNNGGSGPIYFEIRDYHTKHILLQKYWGETSDLNQTDFQWETIEFESTHILNGRLMIGINYSGTNRIFLGGDANTVPSEHMIYHRLPDGLYGWIEYGGGDLMYKVNWTIFYGNGTYHQTNTNFSDYGRTYYWNLSVADVSGNVYNSPIYHFTTWSPVQLPDKVYVDNNFNSSTSGWNVTHFDNIQDGIDAVMENGTVYVFNGTYYENIVVDKTINLIGEDRDTTIIDGGDIGNVVYVTADEANISGFTIQHSGNGTYNTGIRIINILFNNNVITNCYICNNTNGIIISGYSNNNTIANCDVYNNSGAGIRFDYSPDNTIKNCSVYQNYYGIYSYRLTNTTITNCNVYNNSGTGVILDYGSSDNTITNCYVYNNTLHGIYLRDLSNTTITNCSAHNNKMGGIILIGSSNNNVVANCFIYNNSGHGGRGISIVGSFNTITNCSVYNNLGIYGNGIHLGGDDNIIYHNNFINNVQNAYDECSNTWNNDYPSGGNYWDDYSGQDNFSGPNQDIHGGDGIGDTPYYIHGDDSRDWYPLMKPYKPDDILAVINIDPDTLNRKISGKWITCYIELPDGYDVADIDISTILLNDVIPSEDHPTNIGDYDNDSIPDLMVKFDRQALQSILEPGDTIAITVTGELIDGTLFEGIDYIRVIDKSSPPAYPPICDWIESKGGPTGLTAPDIFELADAYLFNIPLPDPYNFIPTSMEIYGTILYHNGENGDAGTGCSYC